MFESKLYQLCWKNKQTIVKGKKSVIRIHMTSRNRRLFVYIF